MITWEIGMNNDGIGRNGGINIFEKPYTITHKSNPTNIPSPKLLLSKETLFETQKMPAIVSKFITKVEIIETELVSPFIKIFWYIFGFPDSWRTTAIGNSNGRYNWSNFSFWVLIKIIGKAIIQTK